MKAVPGTLQSGGASFATTHWSVIAACTRGDETADAALAQLCRDYWPPLYSFVRRRGYNPPDAQDLVQGFFAFLLETKAYAKTDRNKGKFRTFLLASLKHYMADVWDRERALKRGGDQRFVSLDDEMEVVERMYVNEPATTTLDEEQHYEQRWAIRAFRKFSQARSQRRFTSSVVVAGIADPVQGCKRIACCA